MTISEMQNEVIAAGWQFREHFFNDGRGTSMECYVEISCSTSPHVFTIPDAHDERMQEERRKNFGWGRFSRISCWMQAVEFVRSHPIKKEQP